MPAAGPATCGYQPETRTSRCRHGRFVDAGAGLACGDIQPWVGAAPNLNPPQSESQPTPIAGTGST